MSDIWHCVKCENCENGLCKIFNTEAGRMMRYFKIKNRICTNFKYRDIKEKLLDEMIKIGQKLNSPMTPQEQETLKKEYVNISERVCMIFG